MKCIDVDKMLDEAISPENRQVLRKYKKDKTCKTTLSRGKYIKYHQKMMEVVRSKR